MSEPERWTRALTSAGWLLLVAYLTILAGQVNRARRITESQFSDGVWGQRIEVLSFSAIPQNIVVLVAAASAAIAAAILARSTVAELDPWLHRLVRGVAGTAAVALALGAIGIVWVLFRDADPAGDFGEILSRVGGGLIAVAVIRLCSETGRLAVAPPPQG